MKKSEGEKVLSDKLGCPICGTECGLSQYECEDREDKTINLFIDSKLTSEWRA